MNEKKMFQKLDNTPYKLSVYKILKERSVVEAADYIEPHLKTAMIFDRTNKLWRFAAEGAGLESGLLLEFGVFKGTSINFLADIFKGEEIHGFDSFEGLAEDWTGYHLPKGSFDMQGKLPNVRDNVKLHKGWFDKTLPGFLKDHEDQIKFCHIDCDTYESALYVLELIAPRLVKGSVVVFDEYYAYPNWQKGEYKAWQKVCKSNKISYKYIAFAEMQVAVEIL